MNARFGERGLERRLDRAARTVAAQHQNLLPMVREFVQAVEAGNGVRILLAPLKSALEDHFSLEEGTYFPAFHGLRPELERDLEALVHDHEKLRAQLESLAERVAKDLRDGLAEASQAFGRALSDHEAREEALLRTRG